MKFKQFNSQIATQFARMCSNGKLFRSSVTGAKVWETYLNSFLPENNGIFRDSNSSTHNCNCCANFLRRYGNIVSISEEGKLESIFSGITDAGEYTNSAVACNELLTNNPIQDVFLETYQNLDKTLNYEKTNKNQEIFKLGIGETHFQYTKEYEDQYGHKNSDGSYRVDFNKVYTFHHFELELPKQFVDFSGKSIEQIMASYRDKYSVFKRAIEEIPVDTMILVRDLINQGSLLDGTSHLSALQKMIDLSQLLGCDPAYYGNTLNNWFWETSYSLHESVAKFKNHLIGVLCTELAEGKELNKACEDWNKRVDPVNYNKAKAPITEAQKKLAEKFVIENGYLESFHRRLATIDDIKASEILYKNSDNAKAKTVTIFDSVKPSGTGRHKRSEFDKVEEVSIEKFMSDILPTTTNVELLMENKFEGNLVNLTTIVDKEAKQIFKWGNPFSYTFNGNLAGKSQIKENVKSAGGKVDGILRFSIQWNDEDTKGILDYDAHCITPNTEIYYSHKQDGRSGGWLDVDMVRPKNIGVENITWQNKSKMQNGKYVFFNRHFSGESNCGFKAQIEIEGQIYDYYYASSTSNNQDVKVATVTFKDGVFTIEHHLPETTSSRKFWELDSNEFHKVNLVCLTPNHWGDNNVGNKHYLFMLQGCKNPNQVRGFHNEHLVSELLDHRKVLDVLGNSAMIDPVNNQLAGIGFNSTVKDEVILRLSGSHKRVVKVKF